MLELPGMDSLARCVKGGIGDFRHAFVSDSTVDSWTSLQSKQWLFMFRYGKSWLESSPRMYDFIFVLLYLWFSHFQ